MPKVLASIFSLLLFSFSFSEESQTFDPVQQTVTERGVETEVAPGITVLIMDPGLEKEQFTVAEQVYVSTKYLSVKVPYEREISGFSLELSSKVLTEVSVVTDSPDKAMLSSSRSPLIVLPAGARVTIGFTTYEPHDGVISIYNTEGTLLDTVAYSVVQESRARQTVSANVSSTVTTRQTDSNGSSPVTAQVGYQIADRVTGISGAVSVNYDGDFSFTGSIGGSYSW